MAVSVGGGDLAFSASIDDNAFVTSIRRIKDELSGLTQASQKNASAIESLTQKTVSAIAAYATFSTAKNFISDVVRVRGEFQQLEVAFRTMLGSKEKADKLLAQSVDLAAKTPFTLQEVGTGSKQLLAYGFAADKVTENLTTLGNIAAGVGAPLGDIVYLYGTLKTQGRAYTRDILQFTSRGIPIISELAKQFGVTEENVQKLVEGGKVGFPEVEKAFNSLTSSGGIFFNLMQEQSKTLTGLVSNLEDAWARMLNEIGKSNQGLFSDAIKGATFLVENYKEVLKVLEVLAITYGTYRAAIIATNVAMFIQSGVLNGLTVAQTLYQSAVIATDRVMKILNATLLSNPTGLVIAGIAALVSALVIFKKETTQAASASELLADSEKQINNTLAEKQRSIEVYVEALKKANITESEKLAIYDKIKAIDPILIEGLDKQNINYVNLKFNIDRYLKSLREKLALEANSAGVTASIKKEQDLQAQIDETTKRIRTQQTLLKQNPGNVNLAVVLQANISNLKDYNSELKKQQATTKEILENGLPKTDTQTTSPTLSKTNKQLIDESKSLEVLSALRKNIAEEYEKTNDQSQRKILAADLKYADERKKALDIYGASKQAAKDLAKDESVINSLLEKRKNILDDLIALKHDADQSGLIKEQSEIDKINEKYDLSIEKIKEFNKEAGIKNNGLPSSQRVALIPTTDIDARNALRAREINNTTLKVNAAAYLKSIEAQKSIFDQFENSKKELGIDKAKEMYEGETKGFNNYVDFLKSEIDKLTPQISLGVANVGDETALIGLQKELNEARADQSKRAFDQQKQDYVNLLEATRTFNIDKLAIEKKYNDLEATLNKQKNLNPEQAAAKKKQLEDEKQQELTILADNYAEQGKLFQVLNANLIRYTKDQLKERLELLKKYLKDGFVIESNGTKTVLSPEQIKQLKDGIKQAADFDEELDNIFRTLQGISTIGDSFSSLGDTLGSGFLQQTGAAISAIGAQLGNLQKALKAFKSKDTQGAIDSGITAAISLVNIVVSSVAKRKQAEKEYYESVIGAQYTYNLALNDQIRLQNELSKNVFYSDFKSKITDGIKAAANAVENYNKALDKLRDGQAKVGQRNAVDFGAVGQGVASGAALGVAVGTVVPVIGNVIGAVVGGIVGGIVGLLAGKKKKDIFTALLSEYPELVQKAADGTEKFNEELAKSLVANNLVDDATKGILNNIIDWSKKLEEARAQIKEVVGELAGSLGDDLRNGLVDAFKAGTDAAAAFGESVNKTLENIISNLLFNEVFGKTFDDLQKRMEASFDIGGDNNFVDDITDLFTKLPDLTKQFDDALATANKESQKVGLNVFGKATDSTSTQSNSLVGQIKANITEETGTLIAGQFGAMRLTAGQQLAISGQQLNVLNSIESNTAYLVNMDRRLANLEMNGIKIKP